MTRPDLHGEHWQRLDPRMLAVHPIRQLAGFVPVVLVVLVAGSGGLARQAVWLGLAVMILVGMGIVRWVTTRYLVTTERVSLRTGLVKKSVRTVPRDRIRTVDLSAKPVHRLFRLVTVQVGTGETAGENQGLSLDAVSAAQGEWLRTVLLRRDRITDTAQPMGTVLARLDWAWLRYAPLTASSLVAVGAFGGAIGQVVNELGVQPSDLRDDARDHLGATSVGLEITVLALVMLGVALLGAVLMFVEGWWGYTLTREPDRTLRVRRGLLTTRSVSVEERRLRGVEIAEPALLRAGRGARLSAIVSGLGAEHRAENRGMLLPPAPRDVATGIGAVVLRERRSPTTVELQRHPPAALRRRLVRLVGPAVAVVLILWLAGLPWWVPSLASLAVPLSVLLAVDAWRSLGHQLTPGFLIARKGTVVRRTVALQRSGLIGWNVSQSVFQRRAGLVTLTAITAAGVGGYEVLDVATEPGLLFADEAVPDLLAPFLVGSPLEVPGAGSGPVRLSG